MKTRKLEMQYQEGQHRRLRDTVMKFALFCVLLGAPQDGLAQNISGVNDGALTTDVVKKDSICKKIEMMPSDSIEIHGEDLPGIEPDPEDDGDGVEKGDIIDLGPSARGTPVEDSDKGVREGDEDQKEPEITGPKGDEIKISGEVYEDESGEEKESVEKKEPRIGVHGFVQVGTSVVPDFAGIFSDKASAMIGIDAKDKKTGLGLTVIRLDDFHTDPEYPLSRASVLVPYRTISSKDGKRSSGASVEFSFIDQMPETVGVTPVIMGTYSDKGWTFEGKYFHDIVKGGKDMDAFRLGITKKIGDILSLTAQGWYKSDYDGKYFERVIADVDLGGGFGVQLSCIAKDGKLTPTGGVMYKF